MKQMEKSGSKQCADAIRDVVDFVDKQSKTQAGIEGLVRTFRYKSEPKTKQGETQRLGSFSNPNLGHD